MTPTSPSIYGSAAGDDKRAGALWVVMKDISIPADLIEHIQSPEAVEWVLEHCRDGVQAWLDGNGAYYLRFQDDAEADAFKRRWLDGSTAAAAPSSPEA